MDAVADLLALAIERTGVRERENLRRDRIDSLRQLLLTMAGALDIRQVFPEVSAVIRGGLPHDMLVLTAWNDDGHLVARLRRGRREGHGSRRSGSRSSSTRRTRELVQRGAYIVTDAATEVPPETALGRLCTRFGVGSLAARAAAARHLRLRVAVLHRRATSNQFSEDDIDFARAGRRSPGAGALAQGAGRRRPARRRGAPDRGPPRGAGRHAHAASSRRAADVRRVVGRSQAVEGRADPGHAGGADRDDGAADR